MSRVIFSLLKDLDSGTAVQPLVGPVRKKHQRLWSSRRASVALCGEAHRLFPSFFAIPWSRRTFLSVLAPGSGVRFPASLPAVLLRLSDEWNTRAAPTHRSLRAHCPVSSRKPWRGNSGEQPPAIAQHAQRGYFEGSGQPDTQSPSVKGQIYGLARPRQPVGKAGFAATLA